MPDITLIVYCSEWTVGMYKNVNIFFINISVLFLVGLFTGLLKKTKHLMSNITSKYKMINEKIINNKNANKCVGNSSLLNLWINYSCCPYYLTLNVGCYLFQKIYTSPELNKHKL